METQDGNHHLEKQKKLDNRAIKVNKAGQLKKTLENTGLCGSPAVNCSCLIICICICICMYLKFLVSKPGAGGRMPLLLEEDARHFSQTGSKLLRDSLISSDFRVSSGNYRSYSVGSKYTHTQIRTHR